MIFNHLKVLKSCSLSTQSLASCVNYFVWNCLKCFPTLNRFRYKFFDIVQFSRSCQRLSRPADDLIILPQKWFFVKLFFQKLLNFLNLDVSKSLNSLWDFLTSIGSFQGLLAEALEVILLPQRLALKYNTTHRAIWQPLFASFFDFFLLWAFCPVFCIKLHRRLTSSRPCIPCLPSDSFLPYYKVI